MARADAASVLTAGTHGSTFGGNPLACAAASAVIDVIEEEKLCERASEVGKMIKERLEKNLGDSPVLKEIRHQGMMFGIELAEPSPGLVERALEQGLLINMTAESTVRLLPPLTIDPEEALTGIDSLCRIILGN